MIEVGRRQGAFPRVIFLAETTEMLQQVLERQKRLSGARLRPIQEDAPIVVRYDVAGIEIEAADRVWNFGLGSF